MFLGRFPERFRRFHPLDFAVDVAPQLYSVLIILGASYSLSKGTHIRTDIYWKNFGVDYVFECLFFNRISK